MRRLIVLLALLVTSPALAGECFSYSKTVSIEGVVARVVFPGPPGYRSIKDGDDPENELVLLLESPICIDAGDPKQDEPAVPSIAAIQLFCPDAELPAGERISIVGRFWGAYTMHHRTPVILQCVGGS